MSLKINFNIYILLVSGFSLVTFNSCKEKPVEDIGIPVEELIKGLNPEKLSDLILQKSKDTLYKPKGIYDSRFGDTLKKFYIERDGKPVWLSFLKDSIVRRHLKEVLLSTEEHGLQAKFYNGQLIMKHLVTFDSMKIIKSDKEYHFLSDLDYLISMSIISIYKDLAIGRIDPHKFYKPFFEMQLTRAQSFNIFGVLQRPRFFQDSITLKRPWSVRYHQLQVLYKKYNDYLKNNKILDFDTAQSVSSDHNIKVVDQRMEIIWLSQTDSVKQTKLHMFANRDKYIKKTRTLFGLPPGDIDSVFIETICGSVYDIVDNALVSMERERWFSKPDTGIYVYANLTEFMVYLHSDSLKQMRVCVGKSKALNYDERYRDYLKTKNARAKPINSETPVIGSRIREVVINPTWTVPNSIIGKEMYHQIVANPNYLTRKGYEVVKDGKVVPPGSINWKKFKPYGVTVKIRQKAGDGNSLGKLKFNFPNGHNIYMHDTPEKGKFNQTNRAVSHGCVRLNKPLEMAEFLLKLQGDSSLVDKFRIKMGLQPYDTALQMADSLLKPIKNTENIKLKNTVAVYIDYKTIALQKDGSFIFYRDIYRKYKAGAKKLKE
ncbi:MAG: L,D-transpeptidase family protein [Bacteroidia bacterium]